MTTVTFRMLTASVKSQCRWKHEDVIILCSIQLNYNFDDFMNFKELSINLTFFKFFFDSNYCMHQLFPRIWLWSKKVNVCVFLL